MLKSPTSPLNDKLAYSSLLMYEKTTLMMCTSFFFSFCVNHSLLFLTDEGVPCGWCRLLVDPKQSQKLSFFTFLSFLVFFTWSSYCAAISSLLSSFYSCNSSESMQKVLNILLHFIMQSWYNLGPNFF